MCYKSLKCANAQLLHYWESNEAEKLIFMGDCKGFKVEEIYEALELWLFYEFGRDLGSFIF